MTIPTKPDFAKAYQSANEILVTSSVITKFSFSTKELVRSKPGFQRLGLKETFDTQANMLQV